MFQHNGYVFQLFCGHTNVWNNGTEETQVCTWTAYTDMGKDHHAVNEAVNMLLRLYDGRSSNTPLALEFEYDSVLLRLTIEPVMSIHDAIHALHEVYERLSWRESDLEIYQAKGLPAEGLRREVEFCRSQVARLQIHLGRKVTPEEVIEQLKREQEAEAD